MAPSNQRIQSPFLEVGSSASEELSAVEVQEAAAAWFEVESPFRAIYRLEEQEDLVDPETEEFASFLAEMYDHEFDQAVFELVNEAVDLYESRFEGEAGGPAAQRAVANRLLNEHFSPVVREVETFLETMASTFEGRNLAAVPETEIEAFVDPYEPSQELSPSFDHLFGWVKKKVKKAAKWAKKKAKALASKALSLALRKLKKHMGGWLRRILEFALNKLPEKYRPLAKMLAKRLGITKEVQDEGSFDTDQAATGEISQFQQEFDLLFANLLFAKEEEQQELLLAEVDVESEQGMADPLGELHRARSQFVDRLGQLQEDEDPTPLVENFIPAILPLVRTGIQFYGRDKFIKVLSPYVARLIKRFVGPKYRDALSQAIVDAGLRLINLETTPEDEARAASEAVAATVEDTVRRVAALPEHILEDKELLEGFVLEAFEKSAPAGLPAVLPAKVYQERPELREMSGAGGTWVWQPMRGNKYYKKYTRVFDVSLTPHLTRTVNTWSGSPLVAVIRDGYGLPGGRTIKARVHLYEAVPGTWLSRISKAERGIPGLGSSARAAWSKIQPLTPQAAAMILGQPGLGRSVPSNFLADPLNVAIGQRFYYLEIPDAPAQIPAPGAPSLARRCCKTHLTLDFPRDEIRVSVFLSEAKAQNIAMKVRQNMPLGSIMTSLRSVYAAGLKTAFAEGLHHQVRVVHGALAIEPSSGAALRWLPPVVQDMLLNRLVQWVELSLSQHLYQRAQGLVAGAEDPAIGLTIALRFSNPPGLRDVRRILVGQPVVLRGMRIPEDTPQAHVQIVPGFWYG